ncbi:MAG TPA: MGMT family protein [Nitriliruptoraceae bacterium]|nr:MGMT family protein [Nitriliruptoraceae bacterium]
MPTPSACRDWAWPWSAAADHVVVATDNGETPLPPGGAPTPPSSLTSFQAAVVQVVAALEPGDLAGYAEVAREAGHPGAGQAVANVLRTVPGLPWWRVVPASGRLYRTHAPVQQPLLEAEGHCFDDRRITPPQRHH